MCKSRLLLGPPRASAATVISSADADGDEVVALTESTFEKEVGQERGALVEFDAPWCVHCKKLALEYEKLGASFKNAKSVLIAKVLLVSLVWPLMVLSVSDCPWDALQICLQPEMLGFQYERVVYLLKDIECLFIVLSNITMLSILVCSFYLNKSSYYCEMFMFIWRSELLDI